MMDLPTNQSSPTKNLARHLAFKPPHTTHNPETRRCIQTNTSKARNRRPLAQVEAISSPTCIDPPMESDQKRNPQVLVALEAMKTASKNLESNSSPDADCSSPSMNALLELETGSNDLFSGDPRLSTLSHLLSRLKSLATRHTTKTTSVLPSLLRRRSEISRVAGSIGSELQSWIDRETAHRLVSTLTSPNTDEKVAALLTLLARLHTSKTFDSELQEALVRSAAFQAVESVLADPDSPDEVRDSAAAVVLAFVQFNKAVFVGPVLMGPTVESLVSFASAAAVQALRGLIAAIRSPIVDEMHLHGHIYKMVWMLGADDVDVRSAAVETVVEIGYHARKEIVDSMFEMGVIKRLLNLQRSDVEAFEGCVARFAIQLEVGEGLRQREKREAKVEVVRRVREAARDEVEEATVLAEVLWGSTRC